MVSIFPALIKYSNGKFDLVKKESEIEDGLKYRILVANYRTKYSRKTINSFKDIKF